MNAKKLFLLLLLTLLQFTAVAQEKKQFILNNDNNDVVMTWNKDTPESEMKDDIKALAVKGITIKYSKVKRNSNNEITALKIEYSDRQGNKGTMELDNQKPINTIQFFKQDDEIGFGQPNNTNNILGGDAFFQNFGGNDLIKQFKFQIENDSLSQEKFDFVNPGMQQFGNTKSKIIIQNSNKKPLIIEDGKIIEGGDDYTKEELDEITKNNQVQKFNFGGTDSDGKEFDFRNKEGLENFKNQMQKMQIDMEKLKPNSTNSDLEKTKEEMLKAKEDMIKAKEELQKAKKESEKKSALKTQKI
ncbi:hypothetical protein [Flavobacterium sp.]|uniref:hypothetical protein n=1 Tax=Flavobacterium sp. TaxID=239 RepID=UPI0037517DCE